MRFVFDSRVRVWTIICIYVIMSFVVDSPVRVSRIVIM
jgi:hypothetical protein